jgi:hypothetical protein
MYSSPKRPRDIGSAMAALDLTGGTSSNKENHKIDSSMIADIQSAFTTKQRLSVLNRLRKTLQQQGDSKEMNPSEVSSIPVNAGAHDSNSIESSVLNLMEAGIINALALQLHHLLYTHGSTVAEVELICYCFALLFAQIRRHHNALQRLLLEQGTEFVVLITEAVSMVNKKKQGRARTTASSVPCTQHSVLAIFNIVSACVAGTILLLKCRAAVETVMSILGDHETTDDTVIEALGIWKNLTYYEEDCRAYLVKASGFLSSLTALPSRTMSLKARQRLSGVIRNLAISVECRTLLVAHPTVIGAMIQLMTWEPLSMNDTASPDFSNMRRNLLNTLISLAMDHHSALLLILHGDGILLNILKRYLTDGTDTVVRKRSACSLRLLANEVSAPLLINDAALMQSLSEAALRDSSPDVRKEAAEAFARCAALVQAEHQPHYQAVLDALTVLAQQRHRPNALSIEVLARAFKEQALHACNRKPMAERSILLDTVAQIALSRDVASTTATQDACCALMLLSTEAANLERLARTPIILDALLTNATSYSANSNGNGNAEHDFTNEKDYAVTTLVNLTAHPTNRKIMVNHGCLLQTMIQVARSIPKNRSDVKDVVQLAILLLAKEL